MCYTFPISILYQAGAPNISLLTEKADLGSLCPGNQSLADIPNSEAARGLDVIPILL